MPRFHVTTLGCPKNAVDSEKLTGSLLRDGLHPATGPEDADLVVLNTCAFVEAAREESIEAALALAGARRPGARLVVTGCLAERYGTELADALPEADAVVGFAGQDSLATDVLGIPARGLPGDVALGLPRRKPQGVADLLDLPRVAPSRPWAYLKVAEGCDRACAFCAIPTFRGRQVSRSPEAVVSEASDLVAAGVAEVVLVAQDIARYGKDLSHRSDVPQIGAPAGTSGSGGVKDIARYGKDRSRRDDVPPPSGESLAELMERLDALSAQGLFRQRLLYLYPSEVRGRLLDAVLELPTSVPYFDLSLQHASERLLRRMRRWGSGARFLDLVEGIRARRPDSVFRSSFIVGFPGETEADHDELLAFLEAARLDWAGFFPFSREDDTAAATMQGAPSGALVAERLAELAEVQEGVTGAKRHALVGTEVEVLVDVVTQREDGPLALGRTEREAPEIDGVVELPGVAARPGSLVRARVTGCAGPDLEAEALAPVEAT